MTSSRSPSGAPTRRPPHFRARDSYSTLAYLPDEPGMAWSAMPDGELPDVAQVVASRVDVNAFMEYVFTDSVGGAPLVQGEIHRAWHAHIDMHPRALILAPREHGKTEQVVIGRVLWELGRDPQLRVKIVCQDDETSKKRLTSIQGHIERNPRLKLVFPDLRPNPELSDWSKHSGTIARQGEDKDPSVEACGILSAGVGGRADLLVFDDVVDFRNAISQPALREVFKDAFRNVWVNLLSRAGRAVYIATPWHEDDLTHELERSPAWSTLRMPIGEDMSPIWPEMWPKSRLEERLLDIMPRAFSRGFRLLALSDEDAIFRAVTACIRPDLSGQHIRDEWPRYVGVDLGHSRRKARLSGPEKPYTVIFCLAVDPRGRRWPVEIRRGHWTGPETARQIVDVHEQHLPEVIVIENNAYQDTLLDWLGMVETATPMPLRAFTTGAQKADEVVGLPGLAAEFDGLNWIIATDGVGIEDVDRQHGAVWKWMEEMRGYPVAPLSDTVMACWFAREGSRPKFQLRGPWDRDRLTSQTDAEREIYGDE